MDKVDLIVIGAGPGGYVASIKAAQLGMKVVCIDKFHSPGGTCLNVGCIPSKTLLNSTELFYRLKTQGKELGIQAQELTLNFKDMMKRKERVVESLVQGVGRLLASHHVHFIQGEASFLTPNKMRVNQTEIASDYVLIATGAEPVSLPHIPFSHKRIISSTEALSLPQAPQSMIVIGGGVIGVELASVYSRIGTAVTIVEMQPHICPMIEKEVGKFLLQSLKKQGIKFLLSTQVIQAVEEEKDVLVTIKDAEGEKQLVAEYLLVAVGRRPYTANLGLEKIGITLDKRGFIPVDGNFRTEQPTVLAVGDVIGSTMLAHLASEEAIAAVESIGARNHPVDYITIPNVIYTAPEVAVVGLTEDEGHQAGLKMDIGVANFKGNPRARCSDEAEGICKVIGDQTTGKLIGMHIVGPHASELIGQGVIALSQRMTVEELAYTVVAHPTLGEVIKEASFNAIGRPLHG